jgi:serine/threonine-protein kinase
LASLAPTAVAQVEPVVIGALAAYAHPSGVVTLQVPAGWALRDASRPDEITLAWLDATRNGGLLVSVFEDPNPYTEDQLGAILSGFLTRSYADLPAFRADAPISQPNGTIRMAWAYTAATAAGDVPLVGASLIDQRDNKIVILSLLLPAAQAAALAATAEPLLTGYTLNPDALLIP